LPILEIALNLSVFALIYRLLLLMLHEPATVKRHFRTTTVYRFALLSNHLYIATDAHGRYQSGRVFAHAVVRRECMITNTSSTKLFNRLFLLIAVFGFIGFPVISFAICDLDSTFGNGGLASINVPNVNGPGHLATLNNGKFLLTGQLFNGTNHDFAVVRFNADGSLDNTFGNNGVASASFPFNLDDWTTNVGIQSDGKIVTAGLTFDGTNFHFALVRFDQNGILDATFGTGGFSFAAYSGNLNGFINDIAILNDDSIVVAGSVGLNAVDPEFNFGAGKFDANGNLDLTFGTNGLINTELSPGLWDNANSIEIQSDQKIVLAGTSDKGTSKDFAVVRYNTDGTLDPSFGNNGVVITDTTLSYDDFINEIVIQSDGKIVGTGTTQSGQPNNRHGVITLLRYNTDGSLDYTFGDGGFVLTEFPAVPDNTGWDVEIRSNGKIVIAAGLMDQDAGDFALVEYNPDGSSCDTSSRIIDFPTNRIEWASNIAIQSDGKLLLSGPSRDIGGTENFAIARFDCSNLGITPTNLPNTVEGALYDQTLTGVGGAAPYDFTLADGVLPNGILFDELTATFSGMASTGSSGTYPLTVEVQDSNNSSDLQCYQLNVAVFSASFDDGTLNSGWTFKGTWQELDEFLVGDSSSTLRGSRNKTVAIADPIYPGCTNCEVRTLLRTSGGPGNIISLFAWYLDKKTNVEVMFEEDKNVVLLKQKSGRRTVLRAKAKLPINPDQVYAIKLNFDGDRFHLVINGIEVINRPARATPFGTVGFQVKKGVGSLGPIQIIAN
jgi:uncharacterized delta-60 repeat protein